MFKISIFPQVRQEYVRIDDIQIQLKQITTFKKPKTHMFENHDELFHKQKQNP